MDKTEPRIEVVVPNVDLGCAYVNRHTNQLYDLPQRVRVLDHYDRTAIGVAMQDPIDPNHAFVTFGPDVS